jgi:PhnB protein
MAVTHRPAGFSAVTPYLLVEDAERLLAFLCDAFGAQELELHRVTMPDGRIMTAAVRIEDAILELGTASSTFPARAGAFHLYVADVDAAYARALAAGARSLYAHEGAVLWCPRSRHRRSRRHHLVPRHTPARRPTTRTRAVCRPLFTCPHRHAFWFRAPVA